MAAKQNILGLIDASRKIRRPPLVGMQFLHEGSVSTTDFLRTSPGLKAKDLISLLFSHFAARSAARLHDACHGHWLLAVDNYHVDKSVTNDG